MEALIKVADGYELTPSKSGIEAMINDMMFKIDIVLGRIDLDTNPEIEDIQLPEGFGIYSVANLAAQAAMMETFAKEFKKAIAARMPDVMKAFEGDPAMSKNGKSFTYNGVTFTRKDGKKEYDFSSNEKWKKKNAKVIDLEFKLKDAQIELKAIEDKMKNSGEGYVTDQAPESVSMSLGK